MFPHLNSDLCFLQQHIRAVHTLKYIPLYVNRYKVPTVHLGVHSASELRSNKRFVSWYGVATMKGCQSWWVWLIGLACFVQG